MSSITIPLEIEFTPRSRAIVDALFKAIGPQFKADDPASTNRPELLPGEHYAGVVLDENGQHKHHLVLMAPRPSCALNWENATSWASLNGGVLPTRQEQALLYANCKPHLKPEWHWSSETHESNASYAWYCHFFYGSQNLNHMSYEGSAVAVRRA